MKTRTTLIAMGSILAIAGAITYAALQPQTASSDNAKITVRSAMDSLKSALHKRSFNNPTASKKEDSLVDAADSSIAKSLPKIDYTSPIVPPVQTNPGGKSSALVSYSNLNGTTITSLTFDALGKSVDLLTLNNCKNVHITLCKFANTGGRSIVLNNCSNVTIDFNYFTMVGFGVDAIGCTGGIKTNFNQGLNLWQPAKYNNNFAHWVQYYKCSGPDMQINDNSFQSIDGVALHPHDGISIDLTSGTAASPIQIYRNKIKGGQVAGGWPGQYDTGVGITAPDEGGSYYAIRWNIVVNSGVNGIICVTTSTSAHILVDSNIIVNDNKNAIIAYDGFTCTGAKTDIIVSNNRVRWLTNKGGYTGYWFGGSSSISGGTLKNNNWNDATLTSAIIPDNIITYK